MSLIAPTPLQTGPAPVHLAVDGAVIGGKTPAVVLQVCTTSGANLYFISPDSADRIANDLKAAAAAARSGLIIAQDLPTPG